jgi:hypothetical protein
MEPETNDNIIWENSLGAVTNEKVSMIRKRCNLKSTKNYIAETSSVDYRYER